MKTVSSFARVVLLLVVGICQFGTFQAFVPPRPLPAGSSCCTTTTSYNNRLTILKSTFQRDSQGGLLFADEEEIIPIAENYLHAKYKATAASHQHKVCDKNDVKELLRSVLPPVTPEELQIEVDRTLDAIMKSNPENSDDSIAEDDFVKSILQNTYWRNAGSLVVKELMYFDALYSYYRTGTSLLNNDDYQALKDNLSWEGSSVATMSAKEALFVTAVSSSQRGEPIMNDEEYNFLKQELKKQNSWVTARQKDALEKHGLATFLGYLHRAL